ncbi:hypothetical protein ACFWD7_35455 [Streptomyces mirabilis]|uniref:hypothetical protein n=1 Tax=Streptomyces mirabilis TaxID=68239 RepID=UPI0036AF1704
MSDHGGLLDHEGGRDDSGGTAGDLFAQTLKIGYFLTTVALFLLFVVTLVVQLRSRRYNPFFYRTVILSTSMAGTTMSDFMNRDASAKYLSSGAASLGWGPQGLGLGYPTGAAILISILVVVFLSDSSGLGYAGGAALVTGVPLVLVALMRAPVVPNVLLL